MTSALLETTIEVVHGDRRLRSARLGSGPPIVLLHGYPDNLQIWSNLAPLLAEHFEVLAFDWPGMGYSDEWPGGATPFHQAERLLALLDHWRLERVHIVGYDMGGQPALAFAAKHPERMASLSVMNSLLMWDADTSWELKLLRRFGYNRLLIGRFPRLVFWRAERTFLPRGVSLPDAVRHDFWQSFRRAQVRRFIVRMCAGYQGTLRRLAGVYGQIACPTLLLWGEQDVHFPPVHAIRAQALIAGSVLKVVPGAGHWMPWQQPHDVSRALADFAATAR
jgi:pimeloyl-ACP methyl ester carboxylesterase